MKRNLRGNNSRLKNYRYNNAIALLLLIFNAVMIYNFYLALSLDMDIEITGKATTTGSLTLSVLSEDNRAPSITSTAVTSATEDSEYTYTVNATDPEGDNLRFYDNTSLFNINPDTGLIKFTPKTDAISKNYSIKISASDQKGGFGNQTFDLNITSVNDRPSITPIQYITLVEGISKNFSIVATDEETPTASLTYNVTGVSFGKILINNIINFSPSLTDSGNYTLNISVSDGVNLESINVSLIVIDTGLVNSPPEILEFFPNISVARIKEDSNQTFNITYNDPNGNFTVGLKWLKDGKRIDGETSSNYTFFGNFTDEGSNAGRYNITAIITDSFNEVQNTWILKVNRTRDADGDGIPDYLDSCPFFIGSCNSSDIDNDGIDDSIDFLIGNVSFIGKNVPLDITVNGTSNFNQFINGTIPVSLFTQYFQNNTIVNQTLVQFDFTFNSSSKLVLNDIDIKEFDDDSAGKTLVSGLSIASLGIKKNVFVKNVNKSISGVCIKDEPIASIEEITENCVGSNETSIDCDGTVQSSYTCTLNTSTDYYIIEGLNHSGIRQSNFSIEDESEPEPSSPSAPSSGTSSSGGGGGAGPVGAGALPADPIVSSKTFFWKKIPAKSTESAEINNKNIAFIKVAFTSKKTLSDIQLEISSLESQPTGMKAKFLPYQFLRMHQKNFGFGDLDSATISFRIPNSWIKFHGIQNEDISLFFHDGKEWNNLITTFIKQDDSYSYYEAAISKFGYFSVGTDKLIIDYSLSHTHLKHSVITGEKINSSFILKNTGNSIFEAEISGEDDWVNLNKDKISLNPGEEKIIEISSEFKEPGLYSTKIKIKAGNILKEVLLIVEVHPAFSLFDIKVLVQKQYKKSEIGKEVSADIALINTGSPKDAKLFYSIRDLEGNDVSSNEENVLLSEPKILHRELPISIDASIGTYIFFAKISHKDDLAIGSDVFEIIDIQAPGKISGISPTFLIFLILIVILILITVQQLQRNYSVYTGSIYNKSVKDYLREKEKLQKNLKSLEDAYISGFLKKSTYHRTKEDIKKKIKIVRNKKSKQMLEKVPKKKLHIFSLKLFDYFRRSKDADDHDALMKNDLNIKKSNYNDAQNNNPINSNSGKINNLISKIQYILFKKRLSRKGFDDNKIFSSCRSDLINAEMMITKQDFEKAKIYFRRARNNYLRLSYNEKDRLYKDLMKIRKRVN
jgi:PGF-pre-PGF domain-containing protein